MGKKASHHYLTPGSGVELPLLLAFLFFFTHLHLSALLPSSPPTTFFPRRFVTGTRSYLVLSTVAALLICKFTSDNQSVSF